MLYIRHSIRQLKQQRGFTLLSVLILAVGIGANTAIFSLVNSVLLQPLPFANPDSLVWIWSTRTDRDKTNFSLPDFMDYAEQNRTLEQIAGFSAWNANLTDAGQPERVSGVRSSANIFQLLGVQAHIGRILVQEDDDPKNTVVVVLSYGFWQRHFGGTADVLRKQIRLNDEIYTVVGVLPAEFNFPSLETDIVVPLVPDSDPLRTERSSISFLRVIGRLKNGFTRQQAESDLTAIAGRLQKLYAISNAGKKGTRVIGLHEELVGNLRPAFAVLSAAVGLVLLIACANLANLIMARSTARSREMAIRLAMGATRMQLIHQLFTENTLLALLGGSIGFAIAHPLIQLIAVFSRASFPRSGEIGVDATGLLVTAALSCLSALFFGLIPALHASKVALIEDLKGNGKGTTEGGSKSRVRNLLILSEVSLALLVLIGAGLLTKSYIRLQEVQPGFDSEKLLVIRLSPSQTRYDSAEKVAAFYDQLQNRISRLPGVDASGATSTLPLSGSNVRINFNIAGHLPKTLAEQPVTQYRMIGPGYFRAMKIPIHSGRDFRNSDTSMSQPVAIINQTLAARYRIGVNSAIEIDDNNQGPRQVAIIGIVGDVKHTGLQADPAPELYVTLSQIPLENVSLLLNNIAWVVRTKTSKPFLLAPEVSRAVQAVDSSMPVGNTRTMEQILATSLAPHRFNTFAIGVFALLSLMLAAMGIYALISYSVSQRTHEIGLRIALGAQKGDVLRLILGEGLKLVLMGIGAGLICAIAFTRVLSTLLYQTPVMDPFTFVSTSLLFIAVALFACYFPARRGASVDPVLSLRS